ncbi:hypothetical protein [Massilia sp. S19_KUP03_FR1]|uniref:hypothetical protein n=1 Tax=Massilia sp. S19_KUP03_FR1 TaxID=3025503 RepID=UPI002FCD9AA6
MNPSNFLPGLCKGLMGGLLGLDGALRVPCLAEPRPSEAIVLRHATGLVVVAAAWLWRATIVPLEVLANHLDVVLCLLAGSLAGATQRQREWRASLVVLAALGLLILALPAHVWGVVAGVAIGMVMGCAAGAALLLVPAIVLLYGMEIKVAGSLALMVCAPLLATGLLRQPAPWMLLRQQQDQLLALACGAAAGASLGVLVLGWLPSHSVITLVEALLVYAAFINFSAFFTKFLHAKS